jgi:hypothetical protein
VLASVGSGYWPTFCHVTAANRLASQDFVYRALASRLHAALGLQSPFGGSEAARAATVPPQCQASGKKAHT